MRGPSGLATELIEDWTVLLRLDHIAVLAGDQRTGQVARSLRGRVPDVQLEAVLLLGRAARRVKLHRHPPHRGGEDNSVIPEAGRLVRVVTLHPGVVRGGKVGVSQSRGAATLARLGVELGHARQQVLHQGQNLVDRQMLKSLCVHSGFFSLIF